MSSPEALTAVLDQLIDRLGYREKIDEVRAVESWAHIAGPQINRITDKAWVKDRTLHVNLSSAAWRQQLHMQRREWCRRLNDDLGSEIIDQIVFR